MPSDPLVNLSTAGAAAFCARICVHPLDHVKASMSLNATTPSSSQLTLVTRLLDHFRHLDHYLHHPTSSTKTNATASRTTTTTATITTSLIRKYRGLYQGVSFALVIQVPALAVFLSTYDGTKHLLAHMSHTLHLPVFHLHHVETHLVSGAMAKVVGTLLWAPQQSLQDMMNQQHQKQYPGQRQGQGRPITVRDAVLFTKRLCRDQGGGRGIVTLWSGYQKSAMTLLPYTAVYFAAYEKLKQLVRYYDLHGHGQRKDQQQRSSNKNGASTILLEDNNTSRSSSSSSREYSLHLMASTPTPLNLGTYMACVVGAVAISATLCHTASVVKSHLQRQMGTTASSFMSGIANRVSASSSSSSLPVSTTATPTTTHTTTAAITRPGGPLQFFLPPQHQHQQQQLQQLQQLQQQHAHLTTTTANYTSATTTTTATATSMDARVMSRRTKLLPCQKVTKNNNITSYAFLRTLTRGLGPRIMWTAPGVALTTAGFEVFRNMALGVV